MEKKLRSENDASINLSLKISGVFFCIVLSFQTGS